MANDTTTTNGTNGTKNLTPKTVINAALVEAKDELQAGLSQAMGVVIDEVKAEALKQVSTFRLMDHISLDEIKAMHVRSVSQVLSEMYRNAAEARGLVPPRKKGR